MKKQVYCNYGNRDITLIEVYLNWLNCFTFFIPVEGRLVVRRDYMIFLSLILDIIMVSMSTVIFLTQLGSGILCLQNAFIYSMI